MSALAALTRYYDRLADQGEVPPFGYSLEKIGWCIVIDANGAVDDVVSLHDTEGRRPKPRLVEVPQPVKRTSAVASNFLWDKTAYALGVTAGAGRRTSQEHEAFKALHRDGLAGTEDPGLRALLAFLDRWRPEHFTAPSFPDDMRDGNVVFRFGPQRDFLHQIPAAKAIWAQRSRAEDGRLARCLVTGDRAPIARLHPAIRGVRGAQSSGASIVSFNLDAFTSYGHDQGENAPISQQAAFAYTAVLSRFLARGSRQLIQVGDASTVFWADASEAEQIDLAEDVFAAGLGVEIDEGVQSNRVRSVLEGLAKGRPLSQLAPELDEGVRFYVLGLSPNAARLSVRFWFEDSFAAIAAGIATHARDLRLEPPPRETQPDIRRLLLECAVRRKPENIPPQLAGETLRAVLTGQRYPATLLATLLMRLRVDGEVTALRVALLRALIARGRRLDSTTSKEEPPVSHDPDCKEPGYLLGQLFALYEYAQSAALGYSVNATIKDKFYGAAATTPRSIFPLLDRGSVSHLAKLRKERRPQAVSIEKQIAEIMARLSPGNDPFPRALAPEQQALFALGYYHDRNRHYSKRASNSATTEEAIL